MGAIEDATAEMGRTEGPGPEPEPDLPLATADDLGPEGEWEPCRLPRLQRIVHVRYAGTHEISYLSLLPDMLDFATMAKEAFEAQERGEKDRSEEENPARFTTENARWRQRLAHLVVMDPQAPKMPNGQARLVPCEDCPNLLHPKSLWSNRRTARLHGDDLLAIAAVTLSVRELRAVRPLSSDPTPSGSPEPASTGESTPQTS